MASTYRWKGKVESANEFLLLIKTTKKRFAAVRDAVRELHSYEVPEIIALPIGAGSRDLFRLDRRLGEDDVVRLRSQAKLPSEPAGVSQQMHS